MKPTEPILLGEIITEFLNNRQLSRASAEGRAKEVWREVAGEYVASFTEDVFLREGTLYLKINSSAARNEIHIRRRYYIDKVNEYFGESAVKRILLR